MNPQDLCPHGVDLSGYWCVKCSDVSEFERTFIDDPAAVTTNQLPERDAGGLTLNEYMNLALRTANPDQTFDDQLMNGALGLAGEAGEVADAMAPVLVALLLNGKAGKVADAIKKYRFQGHELKHSELLKEAGDCLWYVALLAKALNVTLEDIARANIKKLDERYGGKFSVEKSVNRKDGAP